MLQVVTLSVGPLQANCHLLIDAEAKRALVVDPGDEGERIADELARRGLEPEAVWLTHAHIDHVGGVEAFVRRHPGIAVHLHPAEADWLREGRLNLADAVAIPYEPYDGPQEAWEEGDEREALGRRWRVMHVPGHSPGLCALICDEEKLAATGDLIFEGGMGRVDLPGGDPAAMEESLRRFIREDDGLRCLTGHGPDVVLGEQKRRNPFLQ